MATPQQCPSEEDLIRFVYGQLSAAESDAWDRHLAICNPCRLAVDWIQRRPAAREQSDVKDPSLARTETSASEDLSEGGSAASSAGSSLGRAASGSAGSLVDRGVGRPGSAVPNPISRKLDQDDIDDREFEHALGRIGKYEVISVVGKGAFGTVFKAYDEQLRRMVALKLLKRSVADNAVAVRRFIREARAGATISHSNVVTTYAVEEVDGVPLLVMEFVSGRTLRERIGMLPALEVVEIIRIAAQIASGLAAAHAQGVVHRDVKPSNVLLENGVERVKLTDFGLATCKIDNLDLTPGNLMVGTPAYMSPEQAQGGMVDERADLFGLGCVIYAMATGDSPFLDKTSLSTSRKVLEWDPPRLDKAHPEVSSSLADIVVRLLEKDPANRYATASEVAELLNEQLIELNHASPTPFAKSDLRKTPISALRFARWASIAAVLLLILAAWSLSTRGTSPSERQPSTKSKSPGNESVVHMNAEELTDFDDSLTFDLSIWRPGDESRQGRSVRERGILPISERDGLRVEVETSPARYVYLLWIDAKGRLYPVYPWRPGEWDELQATAAVSRVSLPEAADTAWPNTGETGMETLVLLAANNPPPSNVDFMSLLSEFPAIPGSEDRTLFEFDQSGHLRGERERRPQFSGNTPLVDHIQQTRKFIQERLASNFPIVRILRFANQAGSAFDETVTRSD